MKFFLKIIFKTLTGFLPVFIFFNLTCAEPSNIMQSKMTLENVLNELIKTHPEIQEAKKEYDSVAEERQIATSGYMPVIGAEISAGPEITDGIDTNDEKKELTASTATLYARLNLFNGGKTKNYVKEVDARILAAAYNVIGITNQVFLDTIEAYIDVIKSRELLRLAESNVYTQEQILNQVREKAESGFNRISDLKNSESRLALARSNYISRQQTLNQALVKFHREFGRFIEPDNFVTPKPMFTFTGTAEETADLALKNHPAIKVAKYNILTRQLTYKKSKAEYFPKLDLELKAQRRSDTGGDEGDTDQASAMIKLSYTFFDGGARKGNKLKNFQNIHKENYRSYIERRNVNQAARLAWNIFEAEKNKKKFIDDHVKLSLETLEAFKEEYHIGRRTLLDILNMENEYNSAENARTESIYSYLAAYYRISSATGVIAYEFDSGLRKELNLPELKEINAGSIVALEKNRDKDMVDDICDQCDNSIKEQKNIPFGCDDKKAYILGYKKPYKLSPYITPKEGTPDELNLKIDKRKDTQSIHLDSIRFNFNSHKLSKETKEQLKFIAHQFKSAKNFKIEVIGHTDNLGSSKYNKKLSSKRAESVYKELIKLGISKELLSYLGKGEEEPIASNDTKEGQNKNRRTEFKLIKIQ